MKYKKWIAFFVVFVLAVIGEFFLQQRYTTLLSGGAEYQWPVRVSRQASWIPSDYLQVTFLGNRALWSGDIPPEVNQEVYVALSVDASGLLQVKNAGNNRPTDGEYIIARVSKYENGLVEFSIPFDRVKVDMSKINPQFYSSQYKGILLATLKLRDGRGVVTGIYAKGVPLEIAKPESIDDADKKDMEALQKILSPTGKTVKDGKNTEIKAGGQ